MATASYLRPACPAAASRKGIQGWPGVADEGTTARVQVQDPPSGSGCPLAMATRPMAMLPQGLRLGLGIAADEGRALDLRDNVPTDARVGDHADGHAAANCQDVKIARRSGCCSCAGRGEGASDLSHDATGPAFDAAGGRRRRWRGRRWANVTEGFAATRPRISDLGRRRRGQGSGRSSWVLSRCEDGRPHG